MDLYYKDTTLEEEIPVINTNKTVHFNKEYDFLQVPVLKIGFGLCPKPLV
jgi:hypothetical protein